MGSLHISNAHAIYGPIVAKLQQVEFEINQLNTRFQNVERQMERLRNAVEGVEMARATAIKERVGKVKNRLEGLYEDAKEDFIQDKCEIQNDYDNTQLEVINNFLKDTSTNTKSIDRLKEDYASVNGLVESMMADVEEMKNARNFNYVMRRSRLLGQKNKIQQNLDDFTRIRMETAEMISGTQTMIPAKKPVTIYVPFWIVGMTDQNGNSSRHILPIQEVGQNQSEPIRSEPYAEHLTVSHTFNFLELIEDVKTPGIAEQARANSILDRKDKLIEKVHDDMSHNLESKTIYNDSYFIWAMRNFINAPPPRINQIIQNIKQQEARK